MLVKLLYEFESPGTIFNASAKVDDHLMCRFIDEAHYSNLRSSFGQIGLVDTESVNPKDSLCGP